MKIKYDKIGIGYNNTRKPDPYLISQMLYHLQPKKGGLYLDVGCGTGNYTNEFQKKGIGLSVLILRKKCSMKQELKIQQLITNLEQPKTPI